MLNILNLIDDAKCYEMVRQLRWPHGVRCAHCDHFWVKKRGFHNKSKQRQRRHSTLGYVSPVVYEATYYQSQHQLALTECP